MHHKSVAFVTGLLFCAIASGQARRKTVEARGLLPIRFEANQGQSDRGVKFLARGDGYTLFLTPSEAVWSLRAGAPKQPSVLRLKLLGAKSSEILGLEPLPGRSNYFTGSDPSQWRTGVPTYAKVRYQGVYPGVDLVYHGDPAAAGGLEYDFLISPGADPASIQFVVEGAQKMKSNRSGALVLHTGAGDILLHKPVLYQERDGVRREVAGGYVLKGKNRVGFRVDVYDRSLPLVIDPTVGFTTFLGGSGVSNGVFGIAVDSFGDSYLTGFTSSTDFPTSNPAQGRYGGGAGDAFVAKLSADGSTVIYSTYLGGSDSDIGQAIAIDADQNAYIVGTTASKNFPATAGAFQKTFAGGFANAFVAELNSTGNALVYSTYLGGNVNDNGNAMALGSDGSVYATGATQSPNFPTTPGALRTTLPNSTFTGFVTRLKPDGSGLMYSTFLGGSTFDLATGIAVDSAGNAYVTGQTSSSNFPTTPGAFRTTLKGGFVSKLNPTGTALVYSTFLGGTSSLDSAGPITVDSAGNAYVAGTTFSPDFPISSTAFQKTLKGSSDIFVAKLNPAGTALVFSTYLGGSGTDYPSAIALAGSASDPSPPVLIAGTTIGQADFPTLNPVQACVAATCPGGLCRSGIVTELQGDGSSLLFSTCLGGRGDYYLNAIGVSAAGRILAAGRGTALSSAPNPAPPTNEQGTVERIDGVPVGCVYTLVPKRRVYDAGARTKAFVQLGTGADCKWVATASQGWIVNITPSSGMGPRRIFYDLEPNPGATSRTGDINVQNQTHTVVQTACKYNWTFPEDFGAQDVKGKVVSVTTAPPGCEWSAVAADEWVHAIPSSGFGKGTVVILVDVNQTGVSRDSFVDVTGSILFIHQAAPPQISGVSPASGNPGDVATILGKAFLSITPAPQGRGAGSTPQSVAPRPAAGIDALVKFNGVVAAVLSNTGTQIKAVVPAGATSGPITVTTSLGDIATSPSSFTVTPGQRPGLPVIPANGTVNAASFKAPLAAGSIAAVFGTGLATSTAGAGGLPLPTTLGGGQLQFNDPIAVPTFFASPGQSNFQVPWELLGQTQAYLTVFVNGLPANPVLVPLAPAAPGVFTANQKGQGIVLVGNTSAIAAPPGSIPGAQSQPAQKGVDFLTIYCTGLGDVTNRPASGAGAPADPLSATIVTPTVTIGGVSATVSFSGLTPGLVGLYQVNVQVPAGAPSGDAVPLVINLGGVLSNTVTIAVQ